MNHSPSDDQLLETVVETFTSQLRQGKHPSIASYQQQHPHLADEIHELLSSVAMIEQLKTPTADGNSLNRRLNDTLQIQQLGDYKLLREIGRGGMGIVFEAIHQSLGRQVAIKILPNRSTDNQKQVDRFRREAQAAARLHHTHIVSVFGVGFDQGHHYYVMEYVDGTSLKQTIQHLPFCVGNPTTTAPDTQTTQDDLEPVSCDPNGREQSSQKAGSVRLNSETAFVPEPGREQTWALEAIDGIADALDHAHQNRLLHRDIKPANLLVDPSGTVRLTDFGLAKHLELSDLTQTGDLVGTPQYLPPEALEGRYDARSEVYALGLVLYELITGRAAFEPTSAAGMLHQITTSRPRSPRQFRPDISRDLEVVIQKAIAREPEDRYQTAAAFRDDLRSLLQDRPISARRPTTWEQVRRWSRRNPTSAALGLLSLVLLALVTLTTTIGFAYTQAAYRELAKQHTRLAEEQTKTENARLEAVENAQRAVASEKQMQQEYARAQANLQVSIQAFDEIFVQLVAPDRWDPAGSDAAIDLDIDGLNELAGIQFSITDQDAEFLKRMLTFYQKIATENAEHPEMKLQSAKASRRVANTYHLIGNLEEATAAYEKAIQQYRELVTENPESETIGATLAQVYNEAGQASRRDFQSRSAELRMYQQARSLLQEHPAHDSRSMQLELARTYNLLGASVVEPNNETQAIYEDFFGILKKQPEFQKRVLQRQSDQRERIKNNPRIQDRVLGNLDRAILITEKLLKKDSEDQEARLVHAISLRSKAMLLDRETESQQIEELLQTTMTDFDKLSQQDETAQYDYERAFTYALSIGQERPTQENLEAALDITERLIDQHANNLEYQQLNVALQLELARYHFEAEDNASLVEDLQEAHQSLGVLVQSAPELVRYRFEMVYVAYALGKYQLDARRPREAQRTLMRAIAELKQADRNSTNRSLTMRQFSRQSLTRLYTLLADSYQQVGDTRRERDARMEANKWQNGRPRIHRPRPANSPKSSREAAAAETLE